MIPLDISVGADLAGAPPLIVLDGEALEVEPLTPLPRFSLRGDFLFASSSPLVNTVVSVVVTEWSAAYPLDIAYRASAIEAGIDLAFRAFPFDDPSPAYTGVRARPWGEIGLGIRGIGLFQSFWDDFGGLGMALRGGAGLTIGNQHHHAISGGRYEAIIAGEGTKGILDSGTQDMKWLWPPSGGRIFVTDGVGWR